MSGIEAILESFSRFDVAKRLPIRAVTVVCASIMFLAGCAGRVTHINSLSFLKGQARSNEQILLSNIIAAAHDEAPTFVAASNVISNGAASASIGASFSRTDALSTITPSLSGSRSQNVTILDYGATKAALILYKDIKPTVLRTLLIEGWDPRLVETVLIAAFVIDPRLELMMERKANRVCATENNGYERGLCNLNRDIIRRCGKNIGSKLYLNDAKDICAFARFQLVQNMLDLTGSRLRPEEVVTKDNQKEEVLKESFEDKEIEAYFNTLKRSMDPKDIFYVYIRSPAQIIGFLGRLAAMQLYFDPPFVAKVPVGELEGKFALVAPFRVVQGEDLERPSAVSVRVGGESYHVPQPDPISPSRDQSLKVMGFMIQLQNQSRQEAPIQGTGIAIVQ